MRIALGDAAWSTLQLQQALNKLGYTTAPDGIWGSKTRAAMNEFQFAYGLDQTSTIDAATITTIQDALAGRITLSDKSEAAMAKNKKPVVLPPIYVSGNVGTKQSSNTYLYLAAAALAVVGLLVLN